MATKFYRSTVMVDNKLHEVKFAKNNLAELVSEMACDGILVAIKAKKPFNLFFEVFEVKFDATTGIITPKLSRGKYTYWKTFSINVEPIRYSNEFADDFAAKLQKEFV